MDMAIRQNSRWRLLNCLTNCDHICRKVASVTYLLTNWSNTEFLRNPRWWWPMDKVLLLFETFNRLWPFLMGMKHCLVTYYSTNASDITICGDHHLGNIQSAITFESIYRFSQNVKAKWLTQISFDIVSSYIKYFLMLSHVF